MYCYSIKDIMNAVANGREINSTMQRTAKEYVLKREEQEKRRAIERFAQQKAFAQKIYNILSDNKGFGFTATDMQFQSQSFIEQHISSQKMGNYLWRMTCGYFGEDLRIKCYIVRTHGREYYLYCVGDYEGSENKRYEKGKVREHYRNSRPSSVSEFLD